MNIVRVVQRSTATISWQPTDQYGDLVAATAPVTATVTRADGTTIAVTPTIVGTAAEIALSAVDTAELDRLSVVWSIGGVVRGETRVDVVGGVYASVADVVALQPALTQVPPATIRRAVTTIEATVDNVCDTAFVPRFGTSRLYARTVGELAVDVFDLRRLRWAYTTVGTTRTDIVAASLDESVVDPSGVITGRWWYTGADITVGYEYGQDAPPADLVEAVALAVRRRVLSSSSGLDDRAMSYTTPEGVNVSLVTPGLGPWVTGIPEVDQVLQRRRRERIVFA